VRSTTATGSSNGSTEATSTAKRVSPRPRRRNDRSRGAPVGATERVNAGSSTLAVAVTQIIDPLSGSGSTLLPGTRPVGVVVTIRDLAGATYDSTASGDWSLTVSAGTASPLFIKRGVCQTPLVDFESLIGAGEARSGCVGFSVPRVAHVTAVVFSPHSRPSGAVRWR
jgi:hypothetical protein